MHRGDTVLTSGGTSGKRPTRPVSRPSRRHPRDKGSTCQSPKRRRFWNPSPWHCRGDAEWTERVSSSFDMTKKNLRPSPLFILSGQFRDRVLHPALQQAQGPDRLRTLTGFRVLLGRGQVEVEVGLHQGLGGHVEDGDFLVHVAGKVLELDLRVRRSTSRQSTSLYRYSRAVVKFRLTSSSKPYVFDSPPSPMIPAHLTSVFFCAIPSGPIHLASG